MEFSVKCSWHKHRGISKFPFIVLKASKEEIKNLVKKAGEEGLFFVDFPEEMFNTVHDDELVKTLSSAKEIEIEYHWVLLMGESDKLKNLAGCLRLWK